MMFCTALKREGLEEPVARIESGTRLYPKCRHDLVKLVMTLTRCLCRHSIATYRGRCAIFVRSSRAFSMKTASCFLGLYNG